MRRNARRPRAPTFASSLDGTGIDWTTRVVVRLPPTMLGASIFIPLLLAVCLYAFAFGGRDERIAGAICIIRFA